MVSWSYKLLVSDLRSQAGKTRESPGPLTMRFIFAETTRVPNGATGQRHRGPAHSTKGQAFADQAAGCLHALRLPAQEPVGIAGHRHGLDQPRLPGRADATR